jgi:hypothetical protein
LTSLILRSTSPAPAVEQPPLAVDQPPLAVDQPAPAVGSNQHAVSTVVIVFLYRKKNRMEQTIKGKSAPSAVAVKRRPTASPEMESSTPGLRISQNDDLNLEHDLNLDHDLRTDDVRDCDLKFPATPLVFKPPPSPSSMPRGIAVRPNGLIYHGSVLK